MAINQNHQFEELNGVKCAIVEKNVPPARVDFLRRLLETNRYTVIVVPSPPAKAAAPPKPAAPTSTDAPPAPETPPIPETPPPPETFTVGVTDVTFNPTNAIFGRLLKTPNGRTVTLAYWQQKDAESHDETPYFATIILIILLFPAIAALSQKPIFTSTAKHSFSSHAQNDSFVLTLTGQSVLKGNVTFHIYKNNTIIFTDAFPASDLLGDMYDVIPTDKQRTDTILARMKRFFNNENFIQPAIKITRDGPSDPEDIPAEFKPILAELRSDKSAIGFVYSHGYEGTYAITWSKKKAKALYYFESD